MEKSKESMAKRPRMEPQNAEKIIEEIAFCVEEQQQIIENLKLGLENLQGQLVIKDKRIQELEEKKNLESPIMKGKMKNIMELPNECLLEIMSYLSTYDILRNMAGVSKNFHKLSQNPLLIRKIEVDSDSWPENQEEKYLKDLLEVLKRSLKLTFLSIDFGSELGKTFLEALPSMNHEFLREFCLKTAWANDDLLCSYNENQPQVFSSSDITLDENMIKYLEKQPNLKILRFEIKSNQAVQEVEEEDEGDNSYSYPALYLFQDAITSFKLNNLQEFHLIGFDFGLEGHEFKKILETIAENLPKLQRLCLTSDENDWMFYYDICEEFASEKNIKLETRALLTHCKCCGKPSSKYLRTYGPSTVRDK